MLKTLYLKNIALVDEAEIAFSEGLNVLSGETGAGKSVILDSIDFALGAKADKGMIRSGQSECSVRAEFTCEPELLRPVLEENLAQIALARRRNRTRITVFVIAARRKGQCYSSQSCVKNLFHTFY